MHMSANACGGHKGAVDPHGLELLLVGEPRRAMYVLDHGAISIPLILPRLYFSESQCGPTVRTVSCQMGGSARGPHWVELMVDLC